MKSFNEMTKKEKGEFLSMDLIERIIRLEQRISASCGEFIPYYETHYFKNLPKQQKTKFVEHLKKYKRRKYILVLFFSFLAVALIAFRGIFTGGVVSENSKVFGNFPGIIFLASFLVIIFLFLVSSLLKTKREKKLKGYFNVIDKLYIRKIEK